MTTPQVAHIEFLVEEPSAEAALRGLVPQIIGDALSYGIRVFQGKPDLLSQLPDRLKGYRRWLPLTPEQRRVRLRELADWGVDLSLSSVQIGKTPAECLKEWQEFYQLAEMGKRAIVEGRVYPHQTHQVGTVAHDDVTDRQVEDDTESTG